jgi:hypothetical protein
MRIRPSPPLWIVAFACGFAPASAPADCLVDQVQDSWNSTSGGFRWQSFTAGDSGLLCQVDVNTDGSQEDVVLQVYEGEGLSGTPLHQQTFDLLGDVTSIVLDASIEIEAGAIYTIHFEDITTWRLQTGDPYPGGVGNINPDVDFWFRTYVDPAAVPTSVSSWGGVKAGFR